MREPWPLGRSGKAADLVQEHRAGLTLTPMEHIDMKADTKTISHPAARLPDTLAAASELFAQVAHLAETVRALAVLTAQAVGTDDQAADDDAVHHSVAVEQLAAQIGAIADLGAHLCGQDRTAGDFEQWLLSPAARRALRKVGDHTGRPQPAAA